MEIYDKSGTLLLTVDVDDNSYRYRQIMGDYNLTLYYSLAEHVELPVGAWCEYQGERYTLQRPENFKKKHSRQFEYTVTFETDAANAKIWKFRNTSDGRLKFSLTAKPVEHLQMFVDNMNRRDTGWTLGDCVDGTETLISYDHDYCWDALSRMADTFETEFEITAQKVVSLKKVEYNKSNPLALSYGQGNGFKTGVGRSNTEDTPPIEILYTQGGTDNIDYSRYGNSELLLPRSQTIKYDGEYFEDEDGFNAENAREYVTDADGYSVRRADKDLSSMAEDSLDCSSVYPKRVGTVTDVVCESEEDNFWDFVDDTIPDSLNFEDCLIEGETMTVIFQSGMLAGREFDVSYIHEAKNGKAAKRFEIVPQEIDGQTMPNDPFKPAVGDTYAVFHCYLPDAYICDNDTKSGAEWDMFREAVRYLFDNEEDKFTFTGELDGIWAKQDWENIGGRILLGGYIAFTDEHFQTESVLVRITGIKDYVNKPHSPVIELSNTTVSGGVSSTLKELESQTVLIENSTREAIQFTKRRFRDAQETMTMLEAALLQEFTESIQPITVQTMSMLVGDESLQFRFVQSKANPTTVEHVFTWDNDTKQLSTAAGVIQHMTLGITAISSSHETSEYSFWSVSEYTSAVLTDTDKGYYLYIKASKTDETAEFLLSATAIALEDVTGYYHLLVGILNSEYDGERSFVTLYGFTEVLPGRITTDRIVSGDGNGYFDMVANVMKLGDALDFNSKGDGVLRLKGTLVQSQSGDENVIGVYRGTYNSEYVYYYGDEVVYSLKGVTSTYRYINSVATAGNLPTNTVYWQVVAQGVKGDDGRSMSGVTNYYAVGSSGSEAPAKGENWVTDVSKLTLDETNKYLWNYELISYDDKSIPTTTDPRVICIYGEDGRGIVKILEYYLATALDTGVTIKTEGWTTDVQSVTADKPYLWNYEEIYFTDDPENPTRDEPHVIGHYGQDASEVQPNILLQTRFIKSRMDEWVTISANGSLEYMTAEFGGRNALLIRASTGVYNEIRQSVENKLEGGQWYTLSFYAKSAYQFTTYVTHCADTTENLIVDGAETTANEDCHNSWAASDIYVKHSITFKTLASITGTPCVYFRAWGANYNSQGNVESQPHICMPKLEQGKTATAYLPNEDDLTGNGLDTVTEWYLASESGTGVTNESEGWTKDVSQVGTSASKPYLWNYEEVLYTDGSTFKTDAVVIGHHGRGVTSVTEHYLATAVSNGITIKTSGWTDNVQQISATTPYLWNYETVTYDDGETQDTDPALIGYYGQDGTGIQVKGSAKAHYTNFTALKSAISAGDIILAEYDIILLDSSSDYYESFGDDDRSGFSAPTIMTYVNGPDYHYAQPKQGTEGDCYVTEDGHMWVCDNKAWTDAGNIKGVDGDSAPYYEIRYQKNGSTTVAPDLDTTSLDPSGWTKIMPSIGLSEYLWMTTAEFTADGKSLLIEWSTPVRVSPVDGKDGADGNSPAMVYRGIYSDTATYYGNTNRLDCVKYGDTYYIARIDAGTFTGVTPTTTSKWNSFGASFESIATGLLLAEGANIAGFIFRQYNNTSRLESEATDEDGNPVVVIDGTNGTVQTSSGVTLSKEGLTLTDEYGQTVVKVVRENIADDIDEDEESATVTNYIGWVGDSKTVNRETDNQIILDTVTKTYDIGNFEAGSTLTNVQLAISASTSYNYAFEDYFSIEILGFDVRLIIYKDGEFLDELSKSFRNYTAVISDTYTFLSTLKITEAGHYTAELIIENVYAEVLFTDFDKAGERTFSLGYSGVFSYTYSKAGYNKTVIGVDGMYCAVGGTNSTFLRVNSSGVLMRCGAYALHITADGGVQKTTNAKASSPTWTSL